MAQFSYKALQKGRGTDASFGMVTAASIADARKEVAEILRDRKRSGLAPSSARYTVVITERGQNPAIPAQLRRLPSGEIQLKIPLSAKNVKAQVKAIRKALGRSVKSAVVIGGH